MHTHLMFEVSFYMEIHMGSLWWVKFQQSLWWLITACIMKNLMCLRHIRVNVDLERGPWGTSNRE